VHLTFKVYRECGGTLHAFSWLWLTVPSKGPHLGLEVKTASGSEDGRKLKRVSMTEDVE
jgi:hypothetical protein